MKLRFPCRPLRSWGILLVAFAFALQAQSQSITLYPDFYATQYGVAVTSLTQGQIVNISEGGLWSTNGFNQSYTIDLSDYGEDTYTIILLDAGADGGISFEVNTTNLPFICGGTCSGELAAGPAAAFNFSLTELDGIPGCMDQTACNYDPEAGFNDGSCCYNSCVTVRLYDAFANGWVDGQGNIGSAAVGNLSGMEMGSIEFTDGASIDLDLCLVDDCYVLQLDFDNLAVEASWEIIRDGQVILEGGPGVPGGTIEEFFFVGDPACLNEGCTTEGACNYDPTANFNDGSCEYISCQGCTDPTACNYDQTATISNGDCDYSCYGCTESGAVNYDATAIYDDGTCCYEEYFFFLEVGGGSWDGEISWNIRNMETNTVVDFGGAGTHAVCLPEGCYNFEMFDSFQDGWNNGIYTFSTYDGQVVYTGSLDEAEFGDQLISGADRITLGDVSCPVGCTDPTACNFSPNAIFDSGFCNFTCYGCTDFNATNFTPTASIDDGTCIYCGAGELILEVRMTDAFGDGWNGGVYYISELDGDIAATGTLDQADQGDNLTTGTDLVCLAPGCYLFDITPGDDSEDIGWYLEDVAGNFYGTGTDEVSSYGIDFGETGSCTFLGCTDPFCLNYNPSATDDDGSCECPPSNNYAYSAQAVQCGAQISGTLTYAVDGEDLVGTTCSGQDINAAGVWYVFNAQADQQMVVSTCGTDAFNPAGNPLFDSQVFVFKAVDGDLDNLECLGGNDDGCPEGFMSEVAFNVEQGEDYYIHVTRFSQYTSGDEFLLSVECVDCTSGAPINDDCSAALELQNGVPHIGSVCCTSPDNVDVSFLAGFQTSYGSWFQFNSGDYETFFFDLLNLSAANIGLAIFDVGECGDLEAQVGCLVSEQCAGEISQFTVLQPNTDYLFYVFTTDPEDCGQYQFVTNGVYLGCMDPVAPNYDPTATMDDGTCDYLNVVPDNNTCGTATLMECGVPVAGSTGGATNLGAPNLINGCDPVPGPGVWFTFEGTGDLHTLSLCGSNIDSKLNLYVSDAVCAGGIPALFECVLTVEPGVYASEESDFINCGFFDQDDAWVQFISEPGRHYYAYVSAEDADGDPVTDDNGTIELLLDCAPALEGCTNSVACNFDSAANIEDGSCDYLGCTCPAGFDEGIPLMLEMYDSFGDGWNGADYVLTDAMGDTLLSGTLDSALYVLDVDNFLGGDEAFDTFCLVEGCYSLIVGGGDFDEEISWSLSGLDGEITSGTIGSVNFSLGGVTCGCIDPIACNYDATATSDNGSCDYETCAGCTDSEACNFDNDATIEDGSCCYDFCIRLQMTDDFGDGWNGAQYSLYSVDGLLLAQGGLPSIGFTVTAEGTSGTDNFCLADGCYYLEVSAGVIPVEVGWTLLGASSGITSGGAPSAPVYFEVGETDCIAGCTVPVACNYDPTANITVLEDCVFEGCGGCTYDIAENYDSVALQDDGSCEFILQSPCPTDLNQDGATTTADLLEFLISFGDPCTE